MNINKQTSEYKIEEEIAALKYALCQLLPPANIAGVSLAFNKGADVNLARRQGLERLLTWYERRLYTVRSRRFYAADFSLAA
jgi:hypothetical protein